MNKTKIKKNKIKRTFRKIKNRNKTRQIKKIYNRTIKGGGDSQLTELNHNLSTQLSNILKSSGDVKIVEDAVIAKIQNLIGQTNEIQPLGSLPNEPYLSENKLQQESKEVLAGSPELIGTSTLIPINPGEISRPNDEEISIESRALGPATTTKVEAPSLEEGVIAVRPQSTGGPAATGGPATTETLLEEVAGAKPATGAVAPTNGATERSSNNELIETKQNQNFPSVEDALAVRPQKIETLSSGAEVAPINRPTEVVGGTERGTGEGASAGPTGAAKKSNNERVVSALKEVKIKRAAAKNAAKNTPEAKAEAIAKTKKETLTLELNELMKLDKNSLTPEIIKKIKRLEGLILNANDAEEGARVAAEEAAKVTKEAIELASAEQKLAKLTKSSSERWKNIAAMAKNARIRMGQDVQATGTE
jgi:hypothetical protein